MKWILGACVLLISSLAYFVPTSTGESEEIKVEKTQNSSTSDQEVSSPSIPLSMSFCGENVPLDKFYVREALDRELVVNTYYHSSTIQILKHATRFFPEIERILADEGVPEDLKFVAMAESGLLQEAVSGAGARGLWQIMKATGKEYGLECVIEIDERYHLEKATRLAAKYFKRAHAKFGDWATSAASYNAGITRVQRQIDRQKEKSYYDLHLNSETARYVYRILALKEIYNNPQKYGFNIAPEATYQPIPYTTVEVKFILNIADFAAKHGTNYKTIKVLNPWLRSQAVEPRRSGKVYEVRIPLS